MTAVSNARQCILVVEDEPKLARLLRDYLVNAGYASQWLEDGRTVVDWVREHQPDLVLLDLMLPGRDGMDICRELRSFSRVPVIMVTARVEEVDRLLGLELGADDYICKPFSPREVLARVKAVLRRVEPRDQAADDGLTLDPLTHRLGCGKRTVDLTTVEFRLFETLHAEPGRIFSRDQLMTRMYQDHRIVSDRTIDSHIKKLRRKLSELDPERELIHSVYGAGYRFEIPADEQL